MNSIKLYEVGGKVRDELMGKTSNDVDYVIVGSTIEEVKEYLDGNGFITYAFKPECNTFRCKFPKDHPTYPNHLADFTVVIGDLIDDLKRRDFTINAIAKDVETGEIIDPLHGHDHIGYGLLICPTDPMDTLKSDPIRIIRALRFCYLFKLQMDYELLESVKNFQYSDFFIGKTDRLVRELKKLDLSGKLFVFNQLKELNEPIFDWINSNIKLTPSKRNGSNQKNDR